MNKITVMHFEGGKKAFSTSQGIQIVLNKQKPTLIEEVELDAEKTDVGKLSVEVVRLASAHKFERIARKEAEKKEKDEAEKQLTTPSK